MHGVDVDMSGSELDLNQVRAVLMIALLLGFFGICAWAWSSKRKPAFRDASQLPLENDQAINPAQNKQRTGAGE
jgi:cytochrome c oxidase cbb3-type subunit 4